MNSGGGAIKNDSDSDCGDVGGGGTGVVYSGGSSSGSGRVSDRGRDSRCGGVCDDGWGEMVTVEL